MAIDRATRRNRWGPIGSLCALVTLVVLAVSVVLGAHRKAVLLEEASTKHAEQLVDHEARLDGAEKLLIEIRTDVKWIRKHLEGQP